MMKQSNNKFSATLLLMVLAMFMQPTFAATYEIHPNSDIIGAVKYVTSKKGDTLHTIGRANDIGMLEMQEANPQLKSDSLKVGTQVLVPTEFILPPGDRHGIVINLAELRVYFFPENNPNIVMTFPLGIGQLGWRTPIGETTIVRKRANPTWTPPASIHAEAAARGRSLPSVVPAGPNNPLGLFAMNLGWNGYLMHGTQAPTSIGLRSSHGCMRMFPEDIDTLFHNVEVGTKVRVIYEPYKLGLKDGKLYLEAHEIFPDNYYNIKHKDKFEMLKEVVNEFHYPSQEKINWFEVKEAITETTGYPVEIDAPVAIIPAGSVAVQPLPATPSVQ